MKEHNITQSMYRKGNCIDNGAMENFFGRLKVEMFYGEKFTFIDELKEYIHYYNFLKAKRNEPDAIPDSFTSNLIFNFV